MNSGVIPELEEQRRDALVAYYLGQIVPSSDTAAPLRLTTPEDLYEYLLIDNQVNAQVDTSRVAQGIASLQQYIHAIYNGMEPGYPEGFSAEELRLWRESMSEYSVWAGYQMLEDYPENYIDPTLRLGKTSQFQTLENDLGQSRLTQDSVQNALKNYLDQFELVSNLKVLSGYIDGTDFRKANYYLVGRQNVEPFATYWRKAAIDLNESSTHVSPAAWGEWKPINVAFEAGVTQVRLVVIRDRLHLIWVEVGQPEVNDSGSKTGKYFYCAKMAYKQLNDQWSAAMTLYTALTPATPKLDDKLAAESYINGWELSVAMDLRDTSTPRLTVVFQLRKPDGAIGDRKLWVCDELFSRINLSLAQEEELSLVAALRYQNNSTRLQFPYVGHDVGDPNASWRVGEYGWKRDHDKNYYPAGGRGLNAYLNLSLDMHLDRDAEGRVTGGRFDLQGYCRAQYLERQGLILYLHDSVSAFLSSIAFSGILKIYTIGREVYASYEIVNLKSFFVNKREFSSFFKYRIGIVGRINQNSTGTQLGEDWVGLNGYTYRRMYYAVKLEVDSSLFPSFTAAEVRNGANFSAETTTSVGSSIFQKTVSFRNTDNVFIELKNPAGRQLSILYGYYDASNLYWEELLGSSVQVFNGAARTPTFTKSWTGAPQRSYLFRFGVAASIDPEIGLNVFEVTLEPTLLQVPKLITTGAGAQFLDLEALRLDGLRYVRLNSLFAGELVAKAALSVEAALGWETQHTPEPPVPGSSTPVPIDFDGANGRYFWELFFHAPHLVAQRLHREFDYLGAETWYHAIFNPLARIQPLYPSPEADYPYWCVRPLAQADRPAEQFFALGGLRDPDAIAYSVPSHYRKAIFTDYVKNLIARGDMLYRQLTRDALNEAKLHYVRALSLLGPLSKGRSISRWEPMSLEDAAAYDEGLFSGFESSIQDLFSHDIPQHIQGEPWLRLIDAPWFRLPVNTQLLDLWSDLDLRLGNLRNNLTLDGKPLMLALYEAPANPSDLLRAQLAGEGGGARRLGSLAIIPHYRFRAMLPRVQSAVETLIRFGEQVRGYMELRDRAQQEELLQSHVQELAEFGVTLQDLAIQQAGESLASLQKSEAMVTARKGYYEKLREEDVSHDEKKAIDERLTAGIITSVSAGIAIAGHTADAVMPNQAGMSFGIHKPAAGFFAAVSALEVSAKGLIADAERRAQHDQYRRRREEWDFQITQAQAEIDVLTEQINAQNTVITSAQTGLSQAKKAREQAEIYYDFLKHRSTGPGLYQWLLSQMATLYFQAYDSVLSMCLATEAGWQYEIGDRETRFIPHDAWSDNRHGLNAGEALKLGLLRMESAFLNRHERRLELTKTLSLKALLKDYDPNAGRDATSAAIGWPAVLEQLRNHGEIAFHLNSSLFDKDYPGHYLRQLVSVSLSFPVVLGPYQDIRATLVQTRSSTLLKPSIGGVAQLYTQAKELDPDSSIEPDPGPIVSNLRLNQQVGLSSGLDDNGLFTLNFDDERYLPFEGTGVVSSWVLSFPRHAAAHQQEVFDSLTDIILQVRYLAVDGGKALAAAVEPLVRFVEAQEEIPRPASSALTVSSGQRLANGLDAHTATVTVKDEQNNPLENVVVVIPEIPNASRNHASGTTDAQGVFETTITSIVPGPKSVSANLFGGTPMGGSPRTVDFFDVDAARSTLEMTRNNQAVSDTEKNNKARVTVRMSDGSLAPEGTRVTFDAVSGVVFSESSCSTQGATGQCEVTLGSTVATTYRITAKIEGVVTPLRTEASFIAGSYSVAASTLEPIVGIKLANGVDAHVATVTLRDAYGNPYVGTTSGSKVLFPEVSGVVIDPREARFEPGSPTTSARITSEQGGIYSIRATFGDGAALGQAQPAVFDAPELSKLEMVKNNQAVSDRQKNNRLQATVRMTDGSLAPEGTLVTFEADSEVEFSATTCPTLGNTGQCEVELGSTVAKTYRISVRVEGASSGKEIEATFVAGPYSTSNSTLEVSMGDKLADGVDAHVATLNLRDGFGNPCTTQMIVVNFIATDPSGTGRAQLEPGRTSFESGSATVSTFIRSRQPVQYVIRVYADKTPVTFFHSTGLVQFV